MDIRPFLGLAANWYQDGVDEGIVRYWDGSQVTAEVRWDGSQCVGWWQASDGEFYPPELHPSSLPTPPVPVPIPPVPVALPAPATTADPQVVSREEIPPRYRPRPDPAGEPRYSG